MSAMLDAALSVASTGWPVFPCSPETKQPLTHKGFKSASTDAKAIGHWWGRHPEAMIGVPTGKAVSAFVLDINPPEGMTLTQALLEIGRAAGMDPEVFAQTRFTFTPNGLHLWFWMPDNFEIRNRGKLLDGAIDCVRGEGGYVIVPPSQRSKPIPGTYRWGASQTLQLPTQKLIELVRPVR